MKPVAIFRHFPIEGPGYLATFLDAHAIPWRLIRIDADEALPVGIGQFSGLVFMGGPMSVNDELPWIAPALVLIRQAVASDIPVLGHCLGGQLMAKALGGVVSVGSVKEFGWGEVCVADNPVAREWFGDLSVFESFHWHGETFTLPADATHLLSSRYCENQAFALRKHLAMQCHVEMTAEMVKAWCKAGTGETNGGSGPPVQSAEAMQMDLTNRISALNEAARRLYVKWVSALVR
jgi:GMP synthase-like glutamine amidotransferase